MSFDSALVVDDLAWCRDWLCNAVLRAFPECRVAAAGSVAEATSLLEPPPALALIDLRLPDGNGMQLIEALAKRGTLCIVATVFDDDAHLFPALRAGARGYVLKDQSTDVLADMLGRIADGHPPLSPSIARRLLTHFQAPPADAPQDDVQLSARETDVLRLIAKGYTVQEAADAFGLSRHTVAGYLKEVYRKLSVNSRAQATLEAARRGLIG